MLKIERFQLTLNDILLSSLLRNKNKKYCLNNDILSSSLSKK